MSRSLIGALAVVVLGLAALSLMVIPAGAQTYRDAVLSDDPSGYWRLGEQTGREARDEKDEPPGSVRGGVALGVPGALASDGDKAMGFNGSTSYVRVQDREDLNFTTGDFSVEAWAKPETLTGMVVLQKGESTGYDTWQYRLSVTAGGLWRGTVFAGDSNVTVTSPTEPSTSEWTHLVMVRAGKSLKLFVNGAEAASTKFSGSVNSSKGMLAIGRTGGNSSGYFRGQIDEVAVYPSALSAARVSAHYAEGSGAGERTVAPKVRDVEPITATVETEPMPHGGDAADDPAIWVNPADASQSTIIGTDKKGGLAVYALDGSQLFYYRDGHINNVDVRYGFPLGGKQVDLVVASDYDSSNSLRVYRVDPATRGLVEVSARTLGVDADIYGLCMYHSAVDGQYYAIDTTRDGRAQQWRLFDNGSGKVDASLVRELDIGSLSEGCVADDDHGNLYVAEEDVGIWKYGAEPSAGAARSQVDTTGPLGHVRADVEGLSIYYASDGAGYLIASSQDSDVFVVYKRDGGNKYVTTFGLEAGEVDAVTGTDGVDVVNVPLGPAFPKGALVVADDINTGDNQNFKLVPWGGVARGVSPELSIDTTVDPRSR
jgi:3-phytase